MLCQRFANKNTWNFLFKTGTDAFEYIAHPEKREPNNDFVAFILTRKIKDFLDETNAKIELRNGEALFETLAPSFTLTNRYVLHTVVSLANK